MQAQEKKQSDYWARSTVCIVIALCLLIVMSAPYGLASNSFYQCFGDTSSTALPRILLVGDSLLYTGQTAEILMALIRYNSPNSSPRVAEACGATFTIEDHLIEGLVKKTIKQQGPWDFIVIQQNSSALVNDPQATLESVKQLAEAARAARATPLLYETMGPGQTGNYQNAHRIATWVAKQAGIDLIPVATTLLAVQQQSATTVLFQDNNTYTDAGAYTAACALYAKVFGKSPAATPAALRSVDERQLAVSQSEAKTILDVVQQVAHVR